MSTVLPPDSGVDPDPFRYGWRHVRRRQPDGTEALEMVPLTLLDVLHPQEEDHVVENSRHERHRRYFHDVFEKRLARRPTLLSLSDCRIDWDRPDVRPHGPDLIVLERDEPWPWRSWGTLHVEEERARPLLIIEFTSPHTREIDVVNKVEHYHRVGVPLYVIVDEAQEDEPLTLHGYRHEPHGYAELPLDERGRLYLGPFELYLVAAGERVVLFDAVTEKELGDYVAVSEALEAEVRARQEAERRAQEASEARLVAEQGRLTAERREKEQVEARLAAERRAQGESEARLAAEQARLAAERREKEQADARLAAERRAREETAARLASDKAQAEMAAEMKRMAEELQRLRGA
jgi:Uma2 family endonuclease